MKHLNKLPQILPKIKKNMISYCEDLIISPQFIRMSSNERLQNIQAIKKERGASFSSFSKNNYRNEISRL
jgi:hypothetical protein